MPELAVEETYVRGAWALGRLFHSELHALAFTKELEHRAPHGRTMKEVFDTTFITNEPEAFVDQQTCNRAVGHDCSFEMTASAAN